ncbi:histone-lysine N-methyltransferase ATX2-like isoform X4 [Camellia sinensis]|uniref:histone-lysine N-methyltransferase ATX2-like isoform X4 n=1 Tax=Camellia sinensis TaxID=4442 RepID=UPI0010356A74|nr:histone-lysine N-methyltransferase ATX2-like isoform X4 [Camellia sinensis]
MKYYNICHAMWLAIIVDESLIVNLKGLNRNSGVKSVPVQFFGTHDFARYLSEQKLPKRMLKMQNAVEADDCESGSREDEKGADSGEDCRGDERIHSKLEGTKTCPFEIGDLQMISLGKIVKDSEYFQDGRFIWPEGYTAVRKFPSIADPSVYTLYKMEVLKCNDAGPKTRPLFRVTLDNGKQGQNGFLLCYLQQVKMVMMMIIR